jgi:chemotaxis protein CheD
MTAPASGLAGAASAAAEARPLARAGDLVVGIAEMRHSATPGERLVTYALGSCLGVAIHDPVAGVAGLLHAMLPTGAIDAEKARRTPAMFVDVGVPLLFREAYRLGASKERIVVKVAGGAFAGADDGADQFQIGKRNILMLRKLLWKNGVLLHAHDLGGRQTSRTVLLDVATGALTIKSNGQAAVL